MKKRDFGVLDWTPSSGKIGPVIPAPEENVPGQASRWETFVWPRWLPVRARMPLVAQVTGAVALTALIVGPWWASAPDAIAPGSDTSATALTANAPATPAVATSTPAVPANAAPPATPAPLMEARPAHLNLDVRHSFAKVDLTVAVDGKPVLNTRLEGSGKRFGVFGKRAERGYTKTLDLTPGVHLVRVRMFSASEKFDQTRVERFDLGSAAVASMRISADKSGLSLVAERPPAPPPPATLPATAPVAAAPAAAVPVQAAHVEVSPSSAAASRQDVNAVADLLQSVRSMLIAIAGFVASAATGFVVQEYMKTRRIVFTPTESDQAVAGERRKRRRPGKPRPRAEEDDDDEGFESEPDREETTA